MPTDLEKPEAHLFAFVYHGESFAVRIMARSRDAAVKEFAALSVAEKRARSIGRLDSRDRDHVAEVTGWFSALLRGSPFRRTIG